MKQYKHIIFDLDRTLWDFDKSSKETLSEVFVIYGLEEKGIPSFDSFYTQYEQINDQLWALYRIGGITKEKLSSKRFADTLDSFGISDFELAKKIAKDYLSIAPTKKNLFPGTIELLSYLTQKYDLHILTNGFSEVQGVKMDANGLTPYFNGVYTSDICGALKPKAQAFEYVIEQLNAKTEECIMVGDDLKVDILGAKAIGLDQIYVNFERIPHQENILHEVFSLLEIKDII